MFHLEQKHLKDPDVTQTPKDLSYLPTISQAEFRMLVLNFKAVKCFGPNYLRLITKTVVPV